jgi:hypothetical protein
MSPCSNQLSYRPVTLKPFNTTFIDLSALLEVWLPNGYQAVFKMSDLQQSFYAYRMHKLYQFPKIETAIWHSLLKLDNRVVIICNINTKAKVMQLR